MRASSTGSSHSNRGWTMNGTCRPPRGDVSALKSVQASAYWRSPGPNSFSAKPEAQLVERTVCDPRRVASFRVTYTDEARHGLLGRLRRSRRSTPRTGRRRPRAPGGHPRGCAGAAPARRRPGRRVRSGRSGKPLDGPAELAERLRGCLERRSGAGEQLERRDALHQNSAADAAQDPLGGLGRGARATAFEGERPEPDERTGWARACSNSARASSTRPRRARSPAIPTSPAGIPGRVASRSPTAATNSRFRSRFRGRPTRPCRRARCRTRCGRRR